MWHYRYSVLPRSTACRVGSRVHIARVVSGECRSAKRPPHTQVLFPQRNVEKNRRRIIMYYARPPDHQQPSRKGPRIPARPDMDTSVAPGFPTNLFTPVSPNPHSPVRPVFRMPSIRPWAGVCVRWHPGPHACPMHLGGRQVGVRDHGSAGGATTRGPRTCPGWRLMFEGSC